MNPLLPSYAGLDPRIQALSTAMQAWMHGTSPCMTRLMPAVCHGREKIFQARNIHEASADMDTGNVMIGCVGFAKIAQNA